MHIKTGGWEHRHSLPGSSKCVTLPLAVGVCGEGVVNGTHDLVHALHVSDARVEFGVDEENPFNHFPVRFTAVREHLVLVGGIQV